MTQQMWQLTSIDIDHAHQNTGPFTPAFIIRPHTYTFPVNPNKMDAPEMAYAEYVAMPATVIGRRYQSTHKLVEHTTKATLTQATGPAQWSFGGVLYTLDDIHEIESFMTEGQVQLTDHFGRNWVVLFQDFNIQRAPTHRHPKRHEYDMRCLMMGRIHA